MMTDFRVKYTLKNLMRLATHAGDQHLIPNIHWCCIMLVFSAGTFSMACLCLVKSYLGIFNEYLPLQLFLCDYSEVVRSSQSICACAIDPGPRWRVQGGWIQQQSFSLTP